MGKRVLAGLLAVAGLLALIQPQTAQEAPPQPVDAFKPGKFFTQDDYDHLKAALECINLTPQDLKYEKKHRPDDKLRLKVCDAALDDPLGLPLVTEDAANKFGVRGNATQRGIAAADLLDQDARRWSAQALIADNKKHAELVEAEDAAYKLMRSHKGSSKDPEYVQLKAKHAAAQKAIYAAENEALFGEKPAALIPDVQLDNVGRLSLNGNFTAAMGALPDEGDARSGTLLNGKVRARLAAGSAQFMTDDTALRIPGADSEEAVTSDETIKFAERVRISSMLVAASRVWGILEDLAAMRLTSVRTGSEEAKGQPDHGVSGVTGNLVSAWQSKWGKVVIGGTGPNTYEGDDFIGIIDLGGDDTYKGRVACGIGLEGHAPISFVLDLGGNDRYEGGDFTQGFGFLGVGILHDLGGGDDYYKSRFCAQGCGLCGYGELYDDGGDDVYLADSGAQGAGCFGYGHLIDKAGNDVYRGARYVQAFAQVMGVGVLTDGAGNDLYFAGAKYLHLPLWNDRYQSLSQGFAIGNRNDRGVGTGGGVALLLDEGNGNDVYQCDIYGQGSSYWYSLGMLVDRGGNDTYTLGQYGQGAGIHLSAAILYDESGNDTYSMGVGLGQGAAHDWAVGWQIDRAGNDFYQGNGQGMGLNFSVAILLDCTGDDSHSTNNEGAIAKGHNNDISLLLDLAGADSYGPKEIKDGEFTRRGEHQLVYDVPQGWFVGIDTSTWPTKQNPAPETAVVQHILIAWDGTGIDTQKAGRTKEQAWTLAQQVMKLARTKGADWKQLQTDYNEDCAANADGTTNTHNKYTASAEARLVKPFRDLALSLGTGQISVCESKFGYHIIKRIE